MEQKKIKLVVDPNDKTTVNNILRIVAPYIDGLREELTALIEEKYGK